MNEKRESLTQLLLEKNSQLTYEQALTWIELLWEDFEATYAKAGHEYAGEALTMQIVKNWVEGYGAQLHEFVARNPKYEHLLKKKSES